MSQFNWIPSVDEVFEFIDCRLAGHAWLTYVDENGVELYRICKQCKKKEQL